MEHYLRQTQRLATALGFSVYRGAVHHLARLRHFLLSPTLRGLRPGSPRLGGAFKKRFLSSHLLRWRITRKPSACLPSFITTRCGCSSAPRTKPEGSVWHWLELSNLRLYNANRRGVQLGRGLYPAGDFLARGPIARRRVSRVAVRTCRRQWPSEAFSRSGICSLVFHSYGTGSQPSPSRVQGRHQPHRLQRVQDPRRIVVLTGQPCPRSLLHVCSRCLQPHRLDSCRSAKPIARQGIKVVGSDTVVAVRAHHTLPRRLLVSCPLYLPAVQSSVVITSQRGWLAVPKRSIFEKIASKSIAVD